MDDFHGLPLHVQNALKRAGIRSLERARALGRDALSHVPGVGPLALARIFPTTEVRAPRPTLSPDDLRRAKAWFDSLQEAAPMRLEEADHVLAERLARWLG